MISEAFNPSHSRIFWCNAAMMTESSLVEATFWNLRRILIRTGESLVVDFMLFVPECWDCDGQQHDIHISHVSPENANYGRNQLQTLQIPALKKWKNSDKRATTVTMFDKMLHWRMKLEGTNAKYWLKRNTSQQQQQIQLYCKPPERWPNWGMLVRRLQWNYVWRKFLSKWLKLGLHA